MNNLERFVQEYSNNFEIKLESFEEFERGYMSHVNNSSVQVVYSKLKQDDFIEKCKTQKKQATNSINEKYNDVLTKKIFIKLDSTLNSALFYKDLFKLCKMGFEIDESNTHYVQLTRPDSLFENLDDIIKARYEEYKAQEEKQQRDEYFTTAKVMAYVEEQERLEKEKAIQQKQKSIEEVLASLSQESSIENNVIAYVSNKAEVTLKNIRDNVDSESLNDFAIAELLVAANFEKKKTNKGNLWVKQEEALQA